MSNAYKLQDMFKLTDFSSSLCYTFNGDAFEASELDANLYPNLVAAIIMLDNYADTEPCCFVYRSFYVHNVKSCQDPAWDTDKSGHYEFTHDGVTYKSPEQSDDEDCSFDSYNDFLSLMPNDVYDACIVMRDKFFLAEEVTNYILYDGEGVSEELIKFTFKQYELQGKVLDLKTGNVTTAA